MNSPEPAAQPASNSSAARRITGAVILGGLVAIVLWITAFSWVTSLLIGSGCCVVFVASSSLSDVVGMVLEVVASLVSAVLAAIFGALLSLFGI